MEKQWTVFRNTAKAAVRRICMLVLAFSFTTLVSFTNAYGQSVLLADIDESEELESNEYSSLTSADGRMYFIGAGRELWTTIPTGENAHDLVLLKTFASISNLMKVGSNVYFLADDGVTGPELWKSNGTATGTVRIKDIRPGALGSAPSFLTNVRGTVYFSANNGLNGRELWKSNGTPSGTVLVKDILPKGGNSNPTFLTEMNGALYFAANDGTNGIELWKSNGSADGTVMIKDIRPGTRVNSSPAGLVNVYGTLFFVAADEASGRELWKSDGTTQGTVRIKDILPGAQPSRIANATAVYRTLFFSATDGVHGQELWKSDGTEVGTVMVKDLTPGPAGSTGVHAFSFAMGNFTNIYGTLFFTAYRKDTYYIWKSNGTEQGTIPIEECWGPGIAQPKPMFTFLNNRIYYFNRGEYDYEPLYFRSMRRDGTDGQTIAEFVQPDAYNPYYPGMALVSGMFYLSGRPDYWHGFKMLKSDGTRDGATWIEDISTTTEGSAPEEFNLYNGRLYFRANHSWYQQHDLWVTDGTPQGTKTFANYDEEIDQLELVANNIFASALQGFALYKTDLVSGETNALIRDYAQAPIQFLTQSKGLLFFAGQEGDIWKSDGTITGTSRLKDFHKIIAMDPAGDKIMFRVVHEDLTEELWKTNGTVAGTVRVKTISTGSNFFNNVNAAATGNLYYFVADDGTHGRELWRSDGTAAGTYMVADLNSGEGAFEDDIRHLAVFGGMLYISAMGHDGQWGLYKSNGTSAGTQLVRHMNPIWHSAVMSDKLYLFTAEPQYRGTNLWITDGSTEGTELLKELSSLFGRYSHEIVDDVLYFTTVEGGPLWRTDGTECGTFTIDIGSAGAMPIKAINETLIFGSYDSDAGLEPHAYNTSQAPGNPCVRIVASKVEERSTADEDFLSGYPNPFTNDFTLRINDSGHERASVKIYTLFGNPIEDIGEVAINTDRRIGGSWAPGVYILQVVRGDKMTRHIVVKE